MNVTSEQLVAAIFPTHLVTGASSDADSTPAGVLYVNGTADVSVTVTVAKVDTGLYKATFTTPADLADYDTLELLVSAVMGGVSARGKVWSATKLSLAGTGSGSRTVSVTVNDGTNPLQSARVRLSHDVETYVGLTNASGNVTFNVDDATWTVAITKAGYSFAGASLVVDGNEAQTYSMTQVVITPSDPGATTGYATIRDSAGGPIADVTVQVQILKFADGTTGSGIDSPLASDTSDANGLVEFPGLPRLATYQARIGSGKWFRGVTADASTTPLAGVLGIAE